MPIASRAQKQQVIEALKNANTKYAKPFEKGRMAVISVFGGNWEEYAAIVMDMVSADTLLDIDLQQEQLVHLTTQLLAEQRLTNRLLARHLGLSDEEVETEILAVREAAERQARSEAKEADSRLRHATINGPVDLKPEAIEILRRQAEEGDELALQALKVRGLVEDDA